MSASYDFEYKRRERRRRERLRKKRIRAALLLIALIGIIAIICVAVSTCANNGEQNEGDNASIETTAAPDGASAVPTIAPVNASSPNIPPASQENNLLQIIADSGQTKRCYLTFDDGPTDNITPQILDTLRRYNVKATFFQVGSLINANPDMARRVYEEGHLIANHSDGHNYDKLYASTDTFITEIQKCEDSIRGVMNGEEPFLLMRFPGGGYNAGDHASIKQECKEVLKQHGFYWIDWNSLNGDAEGKTKNAQELLEYTKQTTAGYNNLIVLMHDASAKQATADALGPIIEYLASQGYTFHRLDDIDYQSSQTAGSDASSENNGGQSTAAVTSSPEAAPSEDTASTDTPDTQTKATSAPNNTPTYAPAQSGGAIIIQ